VFMMFQVHVESVRASTLPLELIMVATKPAGPPVL